MKKKFPKKGNGKGKGSGYEIGYRRPPKATQFKKGVSGNKKGRPKGAKNIATVFQDEMYQKVVISENGQRRTITKIEAALKQLANKAATGDSKALRTMINIASELGFLNLPDQSQEPQIRKFTLRVFEKDLETGQRVRVKPGSLERFDDDDE